MSIRTLLDTMLNSAAELEEEVSKLRKENARLARPDNRKKLTSTEVAHIRELHRIGTKQTAIADAFDLNRATVSRIVRRIYWS